MSYYDPPKLVILRPFVLRPADLLSLIDIIDGEALPCVNQEIRKGANKLEALSNSAGDNIVLLQLLMRTKE